MTKKRTHGAELPMHTQNACLVTLLFWLVRRELTGEPNGELKQQHYDKLSEINKTKGADYWRKRISNDEQEMHYVYTANRLDRLAKVLDKRLKLPSYRALVKEYSDDKTVRKFEIKKNKKPLRRDYVNSGEIAAIEGWVKVAYDEQMAKLGEPVLPSLPPDLDLSSFERVLESYTPSRNADKFYNGALVEYGDLAANFDVPRDEYKKIELKINQILIEDRYVSFIVIAGMGGDGKTSLLRKIGFALASSGKAVFELARFRRHTHNEVMDQIHKMTEGGNAAVILIDDFTDHLKAGVLDFDALVERYATDSRLLFILADQFTAYKGVEAEMHRVASRRYLFGLQRLTKDECITLVKKMEELEDQEKLTRPPRAVPLQRRLEMCTENADRHFVVAMLQLRYAQGFIDIMRGEVQRIPTDEGKLAYRMVCFCGAALGLRLPESVLGNILNASIAQVQEVLYITDGLIVPHKDNTLSARHALIGREVFNLQYSYNNDPSKRPPLGALKTILISLGNERTDVCQFIDAFLSNLKIHRRVKKLLGTRTDQADAVLEAFKCYFGFFDDDLFVRFYIFQGLLYRTLGRPNDALAAFQKVGGDFGRKVGFVYRQMAYVEQEKGNFPAAAMCAIQSYDYSPKKAWHAFQVARILTLNLVRYFLYAKKYYGIAINKSGGTPEYEKYEREYNRYGEAREQQIRLTIGLDKDGFVSKEAIALLRPGLKIFKLDPGSAEFQHKLLPTFQEEDDSAIEETLEEFDPKSNTIVKAKDYTKFGRFLYDEWRRDRSSVDANEILKAYLRSIELNPNNPFTHTSLGTFYKEVERFDDAYEAYEKAYLLSKNSADPNDKHPMYATNLALLIMDLVQKEVYTKERLLYARNLLDGACKLNDKLGLKFDWAEKNRQACLVLIDRFQPRM